MWPFKNKPATEAPVPKEPERGRKIYPTDDLLTRAKNIVWAMGLRGAVGEWVLSVHEILEAYDKLDRKISGPPKAPVLKLVKDVE